MLNSLIESGLIHAFIASIGGCSINYAIAIKKNKKPKMICYLVDVTMSIFIAYYAFWAMEDLMNFQPIQAILVCIILGNIGARVVLELSEIFITKIDLILEVIFKGGQNNGSWHEK
jgi:hypothetical protein